MYSSSLPVMYGLLNGIFTAPPVNVLDSGTAPAIDLHGSVVLAELEARRNGGVRNTQYFCRANNTNPITSIKTPCTILWSRPAMSTKTIRRTTLAKYKAAYATQ